MSAVEPLLHNARNERWAQAGARTSVVRILSFRCLPRARVTRPAGASIRGITYVDQRHTLLRHWVRRGCGTTQSVVREAGDLGTPEGGFQEQPVPPATHACRTDAIIECIAADDGRREAATFSRGGRREREKR